MKRSLVVFGASIALVAVGQAAEAKRPVAPKPAAPKPVTYYMHGMSQIGEQDQTILTGSPLPMDGIKPTGSTDKGKILEDYVVGPNTTCTANGAFAVWVGNAYGALSGKVNVTFFTQNSPGAVVDVRMFVDAETDACDSTTGGMMYPGSVAEKRGVALSATGGKVTVTLPVTAKGKAAIAHGTVVIEISPTNLPIPVKSVTPEFARVLYDSTTSPTSVTFSCTPRSGHATC